MNDRTVGGKTSPFEGNPAELKEALERAEFRSASLFLKLAQTEDHLTEHKKWLADERARAGQLEEQIRRLEGVIRDIHGSTSWKVSYPIRWAKRLFRS
jgi:hypothetical protein